jgi:hypothetical protein
VQNLALHAHGYVNIVVSRNHRKVFLRATNWSEKVAWGVSFSLKSRSLTNM